MNLKMVHMAFKAIIVITISHAVKRVRNAEGTLGRIS